MQCPCPPPLQLLLRSVLPIFKKSETHMKETMAHGPRSVASLSRVQPVLLLLFGTTFRLLMFCCRHRFASQELSWKIQM